MFNYIKINSLKIFLLVSLLVFCACDNRKGVCIEADDFGFEDIERFDVLSFRSPTNEEDKCEYREEGGGFSSSNIDLQYCLNGAEGQDHCEESFDDYVSATAAAPATGADTNGNSRRFCRFLNNDDSASNELQNNELTCVMPNNTAYKNKGCKFSSGQIAANGYLFKYTTPATPPWSQTTGTETPSNALELALIKNQCITSCVERCKKKRACSHVASRLPIKNGTADLASGTAASSPVNEYDIFNPYTGISNLKHSLEGNLFVATSVSASKDTTTLNGTDKPEYTFQWTDASSELKTIFSALKSPDNKKKLALAIVIYKNNQIEREILIDNFDSCSFLSDIFTCKIKASDLSAKAKFNSFFIMAPAVHPAAPSVILNAKAVAIFDYIKIKPSGGIDTTNRVITTDTQHHFGTDSILQIVNSGAEYPIKIKQILSSKSFIYDDISANSTKTIADLKTTCETNGAQCFLIPSAENIANEDKFMPPWKATTLKSSPTSAGGLQISAGSKIEIQAIGDITLGSSTIGVCHKVGNITAGNHIYGFSLLNDACFSPNDFTFTQQTQYKPNVSLDIAGLTLIDKLNLYRSLTDQEKKSITHNDPTYSDLCKSLCYVKIKPATPPEANFACDTSNPEISGNKCKYGNTQITTSYNSEKEQVRIANYAKRVIVAGVSATPLQENLGFSGYGESSPQDVALSTSPREFTYDTLKTKIIGSSNDNSPYKNSSIPLYVEFSGAPDGCTIKLELNNTTQTHTHQQPKNLPTADAPINGYKQIVYPGTTLKITEVSSSSCTGLQYTVHPYILFTATQSGFVKFNTANACSLNKTVRVVNDNTNYPKQKVSNNQGIDGGNSSASLLNNIFTGNRFADAIFNRIANKIFSTYRSFASSAPVVATNYNQQGVNGSNRVCNSCFSAGPTTSSSTITCSPPQANLGNGCGGVAVPPTIPAGQSTPTSPNDGKQGEVVIEFLNGDVLKYSNAGVYHLPITAEREITKIEMIGGGGGSSYDFQNYSPARAATIMNGSNATKLVIAKADGFTIASNTNYIKDNSYTLKIIVGAGGKNSTEVNPYRYFAGGSHREGEDYNFYKKDFGYAGGGGEASVVALVHNTDAKKILQLAVAGGGGGGAGYTCDSASGITSGSLIAGQHILHNADYNYLKNIIKCPTGGLQPTAGVPKVNCSNLFGGFPGYCPGFTGCVISPGIITNWGAYRVNDSSAITLTRTPDISTYAPTNGIVCAPGYSTSSSGIEYACSTYTGVQNHLVLRGCIANRCNAVLNYSSGGSGAVSGATTTFATGDNLTTKYTSLSCPNGYTKSIANPMPSNVCNTAGSNVVVGSCAINTCTAPTAPTGYTLPREGVFTYNYTTTATPITGASCNNSAGFSGTASMTYTCNNTGTTTQASVSSSSGCNINKCSIPITTGYNIASAISLDHNQISATIICATGYSKNANSATYTCTNTATDGSFLTITPNHCTINTCTVPATTGYTTLPSTVNHGSGTISGASCATGYSGTPKYTCTSSSSGTSTTATLSGCTINTCTVPATTGYTALPNTVNHGSGTISGASCATGYSGTPQYTCTSSSSGTSTTATLSGCTINTCTVPATTGYTNLPSTVNYGSGTISGASCATGYSGTASMTYTCNSSSPGSSTQAVISSSSGCNPRCEWLSNVTGQWVDAITVLRCTTCNTCGGCKDTWSNSGGGSYRWGETVFTPTTFNCP